MADRAPLSEIIYFVSNLVTSEAAPEPLAASLIDYLAAHLGPIRASITLQIRPGGRPAFASTSDMPGSKKSRLAFSKNLDRGGHNYGRIQIDILEPGASLKGLLTTLDVIAQQLSLYAERQHLDSSNQALWKQLESLEDELAASKKVARATGIVAVTRQISFGKAKQWLEAEASRTSRPVELLADLLVIQQQAFGAPGESPNRKGAFAA